MSIKDQQSIIFLLRILHTRKWKYNLIANNYNMSTIEQVQRPRYGGSTINLQAEQ